jgi:putative oxidoreductase
MSAVAQASEQQSRLSHALADAAILAGRVLMSAIFIVEGFGKIWSYRDVADYMRSFGVSEYLLPLVIATELGGGLSVLFGFKARWAATALAGFCLLTAAFFHHDFSDAGQMIEFQKNLAIAGGFLVLAAFGPGAWSIDAWRQRA